MLMVLATDLRQEELQVPSIYDLYGYICLTVKLESASPLAPPSPTFLLTAHLLPNRVTVMDPQRPSVHVELLWMEEEATPWT